MKLFWRLFLYLIAFIVFFICGQLLGVYLASKSLLDISQKNGVSLPSRMMITEFFGVLFLSIITWLFLRYDKLKLKSAGLKINLKLSLQSFIFGGIFILLFFLIFLVTGEITLRETTFNSKEIIFSFIALFFAALAEEVAFRVYIFRIIEVKLGLIWALAISSFLFTLMHLLNPNLGIIPILNLFLAGLMLGFVYYKTKNIWFVTLLHLGWNLAQTLLGFNVSGEDFYSIFNFSKIKNDIWTGGNFGFEGSILASLSIVFIIVIINTLRTEKTYDS